MKSHTVISRTIPFIFFLGIMLSLSAGCVDKESESTFPDNFKEYPDTAKISYLMQNVSPDSVARFICEEVLLPDSVSMITSINECVLYAYINYPEPQRIEFGKSVDSIAESYPDEKRALLFIKSGNKDPYRLGYRVAKDLFTKGSQGEVSEELKKKTVEAFRKASGNDSVFMRNFNIGFETACREYGEK